MNGIDHASVEPYRPTHEPIHQPKRKRLICIGAGIGGMAAAYIYQRQPENAEFVIYEKNADVGGTWLENRCQAETSRVHSTQECIEWQRCLTSS